MSPGQRSKGVCCNAEPRAVRYSDLGGIESVLHDIRELVEYPLQHPEVTLHTLLTWFAPTVLQRQDDCGIPFRISKV